GEQALREVHALLQLGQLAPHVLELVQHAAELGGVARRLCAAANPLADGPADRGKPEGDHGSAAEDQHKREDLFHHRPPGGGARRANCRSCASIRSVKSSRSSTSANRRRSSSTSATSRSVSAPPAFAYRAA